MIVLICENKDKGVIDMEKTDEGMPICPNCSKGADECECWDDEEVHAIIAWRIAENFIESEHLDVRVVEEDDDDNDGENAED